MPKSVKRKNSDIVKLKCWTKLFLGILMEFLIHIFTCPPLVMRLHFDERNQVQLLRKDVGLSSWVGDESGRVQLLSDLHRVFGRQTKFLGAKLLKLLEIRANKNWVKDLIKLGSKFTILKFDKLALWTFLITPFYLRFLQTNVKVGFLQLCPLAEVSTCFSVCSELVRLLLSCFPGRCRGRSEPPAGRTVERVANETRLSSDQLGGGLEIRKRTYFT